MEKILMAVYNGLACDGRVQRSIAALKEHYQVRVLSLKEGASVSLPGVESIELAPPRAIQGSQLQVFWFWGCLIRHALQFRPGLVYAHDYYLPFPAMAAAALSRSAFLYDAHELIIPEPDLPQIPRFKFFYQLERASVRRARIVVAANEQRAELMKEHYRLPGQVHWIQNISKQVRALPEMNGTEARAETAPVTLVYQGDMNLERGIGAFVRALSLLGPGYRLRLIGDGPDVGRILELAKTLSIEDRVEYLGRVPNTTLPSLLVESDLGIVTYSSRGLNNLYCAPNKVHEYAQVGLPVVASFQEPLRQMVEGYGIGQVVPFDADEMAYVRRCAETIASTAQDLARHRAAIPAFLKTYTWEREEARLVALVRGALGPGTSKRMVRETSPPAVSVIGE